VEANAAVDRVLLEIRGDIAKLHSHSDRLL
jgi:hypothetical protein